jgi:hypothetical protein
MVMSMMASFAMVFSMVMVYINGVLVTFMMASGEMVKRMVKV